MSKEALKGLIDLIPDDDIETLYKIAVKFVPEDAALPDEVEAIERANKSIERYGAVPHDSINWD